MSRAHSTIGIAHARLAAAAAAALLGCNAAPASAAEVTLCTDLGRIVVELAEARAPLHTANFLAYVDSGFYTGTVFHRVVPGFVVQAGGVDRELAERATLPPVANESGNGLSNVRGSVAAARSADLSSATSQFYVNLVDNPRLDEPGYTVFGRVTEGMDVVDRIAALPTAAQAPFARDVPQPPPAIRSAARLDRAALEAFDALGTYAPPGARAAALAERIRAAAAAGEHAGALQAVAQYRAICGPPTAEIALLEARAAFATGAAARARYVLDDLLAVVDESDWAYAEARALRADPHGASALAPPAPLGPCTPPAAPAVPQAATADHNAMAAARARITSFFGDADVYAACLAEVAADAARPATERGAARAERERALGEKERLVAAFNAALREFRQR